jgi:hypothetical protein
MIGFEFGVGTGIGFGGVLYACMCVCIYKMVRWLGEERVRKTPTAMLCYAILCYVILYNRNIVYSGLRCVEHRTLDAGVMQIKINGRMEKDNGKGKMEGREAL